LQLWATFSYRLHINKLELFQADLSELVAQLVQQGHHVLVEVNRVLGEAGVSQLKASEAGQVLQAVKTRACQVTLKDAYAVEGGKYLTAMLESGEKAAMAVDKVEPPQTAVLPFAKGIVHYGETPQHLLKALVLDLPQEGVVGDHLVDSKGNDRSIKKVKMDQGRARGLPSVRAPFREERKTSL